MCGAAASVPQVRGKRICSDSELQQLLRGWANLGICFTSVMLLAEEKNSTKDYFEDDRRWEVTDTIIGNTCVLLKTTADGMLRLGLIDQGFRWEHVESSYRKVGQSTYAKGTPLKVVESCACMLSVEDLRQRLELQRGILYRSGSASDFPDFAKRLFEGLSGKRCEGKKPYDMITNRTGDVSTGGWAPPDLSDRPAASDAKPKGAVIREREDREQERWDSAAAHMLQRSAAEELATTKAASSLASAAGLKPAAETSKGKKPLPDGVIVLDRGAA